MKFATPAVVLALLLAAVGTARADDPTGTWTWSAGRGGGQQREVTLKLKLEGDKLTGSMPGRNNTETQIENGSFKDGTVSFSITREFNNMKVTTKYSGKLSGDTIKGKTESERNGQTRENDWEAKRSK